MILFYSKITGDIFGTIDGRVHDEKQLECYIDNGIGKDNIGKYVIGWISKDGQQMEYNMNRFDLLQDFESLSETTPLDFKVNLETGELERKTPIAK